MSSDRLIVAGLFALGLGAIGGFALTQSAEAQAAFQEKRHIGKIALIPPSAGGSAPLL